MQLHLHRLLSCHVSAYIGRDLQTSPVAFHCWNSPSNLEARELSRQEIFISGRITSEKKPALQQPRVPQYLSCVLFPLIISQKRTVQKSKVVRLKPFWWSFSRFGLQHAWGRTFASVIVSQASCFTVVNTYVIAPAVNSTSHVGFFSDPTTIEIFVLSHPADPFL